MFGWASSIGDPSAGSQRSTISGSGFEKPVFIGGTKRRMLRMRNGHNLLPRKEML